MSHLLLRLLDVMRLRAGPQDMPPGWQVAIVMSVLYLSEGFVSDRVLDESGSAPRGLLAVSVQFLVTFALLRWRHLAFRLPQTLTALAGTGLLFGALSIVLAMQAQPGAAQPGLALIWFGTFFWSLAVDAHIYRHALSMTMSLGVLVAVIIFAINFVLIETMFAA
jgi:hypothetical protein